MGLKNKMRFYSWTFTIIFIIFSFGCASTKKEQLPAPHNNYSGLTVDTYFSGDDGVTSEMMRACSQYGGLDQNSINNSGDDLLLQDIVYIYTVKILVELLYQLYLFLIFYLAVIISKKDYGQRNLMLIYKLFMIKIKQIKIKQIKIKQIKIINQVR